MNNGGIAGCQAISDDSSLRLTKSAAEGNFPVLKSFNDRYGVESLIEVIGEIEEAIMCQNFQKRLVEIVTECVPGSIVAFDEINEEEGIYRLHHTTPVSENEMQALIARLMVIYTQNPVHSYFTSGGREQVLDTLSLTSRSKLEMTDFYQDIFKPFGIRNQMVVRLERKDWISTLTINSDREFAGKLGSFLSALSPFLDRAQRLHSEMERLRGFVSQSGLVGNFTPREMEVFRWMREGKRNREIGIILGCSERTIEKHVHHILEKTGAETRSGAIRTAGEI